MNLRRVLRTNWDRVAGWALVAIGAVALLLGWLGVSDNVYAAAQLPYILSGGIGGICAIGVGVALIISAELRDQWHQVEQLNGKLDRLLESSEGHVAPRDAEAPTGRASLAPPAATNGSRVAASAES